MKVFGSSGTRGVVNEELTPDFVLRVAMAAGSVWGADRVALARDTRASGRMLADAAASGLASVGAGVDRLGVLPTPGAQAYAERHGVPAIVITASHNPPEYNGVKLVGADGVELPVDAIEGVEETLLAERFTRAEWDAIGETRTVEGSVEAYVDGLLASVDRERFEAAGLTVALDPGHGAGSLTSPRLFRELGCEVLTVNAQPDGRFPGRNPEPVPENLADLARLVRSTDADLGVAHDGDADRAIFYDERGEHIEGDAALAALAAAELGAGDATVSAVNASQRLVDVVHDCEARLELTPVGSTNIVTRIRRLHEEGVSVPVAGEGNGGVLFPGYRLARDGAYTAVRFLDLVVDEPASAVVAPYDGYHNVRQNVVYDTDAQREAILAAVNRQAEAAEGEVDTTDGHRIDYGDAWVLARPSGTEPLVRIYAEARERERAEALAEEMRETVEAARANA